MSITTPFSSSCRWDSHYSCDGGPVLPPSHSIYYYCSVHVEVRAALMLDSLVWQKQFLNEQEWAFCAVSQAKGWHSWCFEKKPVRTMNENDVWGYLVNYAYSFLCKAAPRLGNSCSASQNVTFSRLDWAEALSVWGKAGEVSLWGWKWWVKKSREAEESHQVFSMCCSLVPILIASRIQHPNSGLSTKPYMVPVHLSLWVAGACEEC